MKRLSAFVLLVVLLPACNMPRTRIYSISLPYETVMYSARSNISASIHVSSPRYLSQPYIVHRPSEYELEILKYYKWDSAPRDVFRESFRHALSPLFREVRVSSYVPDGFYSVKINLRRFEKTEEEGDFFAELLFEIFLRSSEGRELYNGTIGKKIKLEGPDNISLARGMSIAIKEGIGEALDAISQLPLESQ